MQASKSVLKQECDFGRTAYEQGLKENFIQIIPAVGWRAAYAMEDGTIYTEFLVCWSLYDDMFYRKIMPCVLESEDGDTVMFLDGGIVNFLGILAPGQRIPRQWKKKARSQRTVSRSLVPRARSFLLALLGNSR